MDNIIRNEITCPHCNYELWDSREADDDGFQDCENCGKPFGYVRNVSVSYTMTPLKYEQCPKCGEYRVLNDYHSSIGVINERLCESCLGVEVHKLKLQYIRNLESNK